MKTNKVVATIEAGVPGGGGEISAGEGSVWVTTFEYPITRIDPATNKVAQQFYGEGGDSIRAGLGWIWLTNIRAGNVWRIDPKRILATLAECRLPIADFGLPILRLPIADFRLPIADCRLPIADCRLPIADYRLKIGSMPIPDWYAGTATFCSVLADS